MYQAYMPQQYQPYQNQMRQDFMMHQQPQSILPLQQTGGVTIRLVASRAEAEAFQIPFDGSTHFFYDTSSDKLYAKTFNAMNGTAPLATFSREEEAKLPVYVTLEEFNSFKEEFLKKHAIGDNKKYDE